MWFVLIILKVTLLRWVHNIPSLNKLSGQKFIKFFRWYFGKSMIFINTFWLHLTFKPSFNNKLAVYESFILLASANHIDCKKYPTIFEIGFLILVHCEGLYLRKDVKSGQIVSLFNGLRCQSSRNQMIGQPNYDYRIKLNGEIDIDIPLNCIDLNQYCATLGHKANHSFTPNCK